MITIKVEELKRELPLVCFITERKSTIPVLMQVRIETVDSDRIKIMATDLDNTYIAELSAEVMKGDSFLVNPFMLADIVNSTDAEAITIDRFELSPEQLATSESLFIKHGVKVAAGESVWMIEDIDPTTFPELSKVPDEKLFAEFPFKLFRDAIENTRFACTSEQSRFTLAGSKTVVGEQSGFKMVATDGHRLAYYSRAVLPFWDAALNIDGLIGIGALDFILKLKKSEIFSLYADPMNFYFRTDHGLLIARMPSGNFPNYEMVMPKDFDYNVTFDVEKLARVLRQAMIGQSERRTPSITWYLKKDGPSRIVVRLNDGVFETTLPVTGCTQEMKLGFQTPFLLDFCKKIKTGLVKMTYQDENRQTEFAPAEQREDIFRYVVMPLRV